jgi:hypothetical protein
MKWNPDKMTHAELVDEVNALRAFVKTLREERDDARRCYCIQKAVCMKGMDGRAVALFQYPDDAATLFPEVSP